MYMHIHSPSSTEVFIGFLRIPTFYVLDQETVTWMWLMFPNWTSVINPQWSTLAFSAQTKFTRLIEHDIFIAQTWFMSSCQFLSIPISCSMHDAFGVIEACKSFRSCVLSNELTFLSQGWIWCMSSLDGTIITGSWDTSIAFTDLERCEVDRRVKWVPSMCSFRWYGL